METPVNIAAAVVLIGAAIALESLKVPLLKKGQIGRICACLCALASGATFALTPVMDAFQSLVAVITDVLGWVVGIAVSMTSALLEGADQPGINMGDAFNHDVARGLVLIGSACVVVFLAARAAPAKIVGGHLSERDVWVAFIVPFIVTVTLTGLQDAAAGPIEWVRATFTEKVDSQIPDGPSPSPGKNVTPTGGGR